LSHRRQARGQSAERSDPPVADNDRPKSGVRMKGLNQKKSDKKKPAKTMKEKKAEKSAKKAAKGR